MAGRKITKKIFILFGRLRVGKDTKILKKFLMTFLRTSIDEPIFGVAKKTHFYKKKKDKNIE